MSRSPVSHEPAVHPGAPFRIRIERSVDTGMQIFQHDVAVTTAERLQRDLILGEKRGFGKVKVINASGHVVYEATGNEIEPEAPCRAEHTPVRDHRRSRRRA